MRKLSKAATAILVKSRAKYGKRLTARDYDELLGCKTVGDIAVYLRNSTHYNVSLEGIKEAAVHRGNLEQLLRSKIYADFAELCKFESSIGEHYFEYLMMKNEIDRLLVFLRYFISGHGEKYLAALPDFFSHHSKIDFVAITESRTFDDVLSYLRGTDYAKLLAPFASDDSVFDFTTVEAVLDKYLYRKTEALIKKNFDGDERDELLKLFESSAELDNLRRIYRAKKYFNISKDTLRAQLNEMRSSLTARQLNEMIECDNADDVISLLKKTRYRLILDDTDYSYFDWLANRIKYDFCRKHMCFSTHAAVVMASTIIVFEIEIENITNIIEGKRYGVDNDTIKKMLILERTVR